MNKLIVISGCSGSGKSTLLSELSRHGFSVMPEVAREVYKEKLLMKLDVTSQQNQMLIAEEIINRNVVAYHQAKALVNVKDQMIFFDRSYLECLSYFENFNMEEFHKYENLINELRYYPTILMAPPWKEIFRQDDERRHSFEDALPEYGRLLKSYASYGYQILEIPKLGVEERFKFVISNIL